MRILAPTRYPWSFNSPRHSRHHIVRRNFVPFNKLNVKIEGVTCFNPLPPRRFDLVHAFNRIPLGRTPFIIGFESHLPRGYGVEHTRYYQWLLDILASPRCRGVFPISLHADKILRSLLAGRPQAHAILAKTHVRYPNLEIAARSPSPPSPKHGLRVAFVGAHFARKGGCVAVRLAELARQHKTPIYVDIVSKLEMGNGIWTDPARAGFYHRYKALLSGENISHRGSIPNSEVMTLLDASHFSLLTTFADTFGYSAIESMARGVPVIATAQGALPEFIHDRQNGILLALPTNQFGEWVHAAAPGRDTADFEDMFVGEVDRLAEETFERLAALIDSPSAYEALGSAARHTAQTMFNADAANQFWDEVYEAG